jgi:capsular exopolysaccharide synthesis family protein
MANIITRTSASTLPAVPSANQESIWIDAYLDQKQSDFLRYFRMVVKRKKLVLSMTAAVFGLAIYWTSTTPRTYTSTTNIQIEPDQNVLPYGGVAAVIPDIAYMSTQARVLGSETLGERVIKRLKLVSDSSDAASAGRGFAAGVEVMPVPNTQILKVTYRADNPDFAAQAVNALADEYTDFGLEMKRESSLKARDFLQSELSRLEEKMQQAEQRMVDYGRTHHILEPTPDNNVITRKFAELNDEMTKVEGELMANRYKELENTPIESFPDQMKTPIMRDLDARRSDFEQKLAALTLKFGPRWPEVVALNQQLSEVKTQLAGERRKALRQAQVQYELAAAHKARLTDALRQQTVLADQLTQDSIQFDMLKREVDTDRKLEEGLLQRMKETDISAGLKAGNVRVIDRGHVPRLPTSPNVPLNLSLGLVLGLIAGLGSAVGVELIDRRVRTPEEVERDLKLPFLGAIPRFDKQWKLENGGHLVPLDHNAPHLLAASRNASVYWESYRVLRTSLLFSPENRPHSILVTSTNAGEGKSTSAVNLAIALAHTGARTLILELDLRRPQLAERLGLRSDIGISRYLAGQTRFHTEIQPSTVPNLFVVTSGPIPPNPPELIGSTRMTGALQLLQRHFDFVVIDGPPVTPLADALVIAPQVSGVVFVVGGRTSVEAAQKGRNLLRSVDAKLLGVLVNNVKTDLTDAYGSYYQKPATTTAVRPS